MNLSQNLLKELFDYNPKSGVFIRKTKSSRNVNIGDVVGCLGKQGYLQVCINYKRYLLHRLAWLYVYGKMPENQIDHINHNKTDNRIQNLRDVTRTEQNQNRNLYLKNKSGVHGVFWNEQNNNWRARITVKNKIIDLGSFLKINDAINVRKNAEVFYGFHKNHGKKEIK